MRRVIISGMVGNGFEWYDFALYGQMAFIIGQLFFPSENETLERLATYSAFAAAFLFRPIGAMLFGWIGDRYGRKRALVAAILMMAIPTGAIGLLPTYEQIGIAAPIALVFIRILQGLSLGGEFGGAITYVVEHSNGKRRGLIGSTTIVSLIIGFLCGSFVVWAVKASMSPEDFLSWGWRIPFLLGIVIGLVGFYIRRQCAESPSFTAAKEGNQLVKNPLREAMVTHWRPLLRAFFVYTAVTMPFYLIAIYFISYSQNELLLTTSNALLVNLVAMGCMLAGALIGANASDRYGRLKVMVPATTILALLAFPALFYMQPGDMVSALLWQSLMGLILGIYIGPVPAILVEIFPPQVRYTGMSMALNTATSVFGGTAPMVCISLLAWTHSTASIALYVALCSLLSLLSLRRYRDLWQEETV